MTTVLCGSNHFVGCETLLAVGATPLLRIEAAPLRVTLVTPATLLSQRPVNVVDNVPAPASSEEVRVVAGDRSVAIFWGEHPLVIATEFGPGTVSLKADLRHLGINIYDDANGLHVGGMHFRGSSFTAAQVAFQLG